MEYLSNEQLDNLSAEQLKQRILSLQRELGALAVENAALEANANSDDLTGLENKTALLGAINEALSSPNSSQLVVMLDLVGFSEINNTHGHVIGDRVLRKFAQALNSSLRKIDETRERYGDKFYTPNFFETEEADFGYRFGGDEFVVLLSNGASLRVADHERLVKTRMELLLNNTELQAELKEHGIKNFGIRAGFTYIDPSQTATAEQVLLNADPKTETKCHVGLAYGKRFGFEIIIKK